MWAESCQMSNILLLKVQHTFFYQSFSLHSNVWSLEKSSNLESYPSMDLRENYLKQSIDHLKLVIRVSTTTFIE